MQQHTVNGSRIGGGVFVKILVVGYGEVGRAHAELLASKHEVKAIDVVPGVVDEWAKCPRDFKPEAILFAMRYSGKFREDCLVYLKKYKSSFVNVLSTVPPGTTEGIDKMACHSTTRGLHPNLKTGLLNIPKHVGGPTADIFKSMYESVGMSVVTHKTARTTELAHILNNAAYGVNLVLADEMQKICRAYGVDYYEAVMRYTETNNEGFERLGHASKRRMVLTPPNGKIGGHCVSMSAGLIPEELRGYLINKLATYGGGQ